MPPRVWPLASLRAVRRSGPLSAIDALVPVAGNGGQQVLVGGRLRQDTLFARERPPVDREVDRLPQLRVVLEQRLARVQMEHVQAVPRLDEEPRPVDPVAPRQLLLPLDGYALDAKVESACRHLVDGLSEVGGEVGDEPIDVVGTLAPVEAVPLQHQPLVGDVLGDVVGRRAREGFLRPLRVGGQGRGHGAYSRQADRQFGDALRQPQGQRPALRYEASDGRRLARQHVLRADDVCEGVGSKRLHRRVEDALERVREGAGRHRPAVGEARVLADGEGVGLAVLRDDRLGLGKFRGEAAGARLARVEHEGAASRPQNGLGVYVRKRGIDCVESPDGDADPKRAALLDAARRS